MNSQQTAALLVSVGPWVSMHLNEPSLTAALPYTRISKLSLLSSTTSNTITTVTPAPFHYFTTVFHPLPLLYSTFFFKLFFSLTFLFLVHVTEDAFISRILWRTCLCWKRRRKKTGREGGGHLTSYQVRWRFQSNHKASWAVIFLNHLGPRLASPPRLLVSWFFNQKVKRQRASRWSEHQSCQSALRLAAHHSPGWITTLLSVTTAV